MHLKGLKLMVTCMQACSKYSIVFVSFLYKFGNGQDVSKGIDLAFHDIGGTGPDITACQAKGVKVLLWHD